MNKENKIVYLLGDYNIDLLKTECHRPTSDFVEILFSNSLFPLITKPTRITNETATIIDNIFTNDFSNKFHNFQGILYSDISDHFPIFHFSQTITDVNDKQDYLTKRQIKQSNVDTFITACSEIDWTCVTSIEDTQTAYSNLHNKLNHIYIQSFPLTKVKMGYETRNPWLTSALKQSIKMKNKIQKRLLRIITSSDYLAHTAPLFKNCKILDIYQINKYMVAVFMYKYKNNDLPEVFKNMYATNDTIHTHSTRQALHYHAPQGRKELLRKKH